MFLWARRNRAATCGGSGPRAACDEMAVLMTVLSGTCTENETGSVGTQQPVSWAAAAQLGPAYHFGTEFYQVFL